MRVAVFNLTSVAVVFSGTEAVQGLPIIPDTEFVTSDSDDDMEGGVAMFPEMRSKILSGDILNFQFQSRISSCSEIII